ncbi:hypothetical protein B0H63DRAFT_136256, partial [Podospora didyma]
MAELAVAAPQVNGVAELSRPDSPSSVNSSTKRKRDASDDGDLDLNGADPTTPKVNGAHPHRDKKALIRDFFDVLQSLDPTGPVILKRPLADALSDGEPSAKRARSEDKPLTVADKTAQGAYRALD